jgi:ABC-2 type transport system permease protein
VRGIWAGFRIQLVFYRHHPDMFIPLLTAPLYTIIFLLVVRHGGRADLSSYAVIAPVFMTLWWFALFHGGLVISTDRWESTIEALFAAPTPFPLVIFGRILAITTVGLLSFVEVWVVARYLLRIPVTVHHPGLLVLTLLVTAFAMASTALLMAGLFVLTRSAVTFANSASFPFYVLGGILVPVAFLPGWIQPVSKLVFLSWSSDLLRASLAAGPATSVPIRVGMVLLLGGAGLAGGAAMLVKILHRVRDTGELSFQ